MTDRFARAQLPLIGIVFALCLGFVAQYFFTGEIFTRLRDSNTWVWEPRYTLATILLIASMICAGWALTRPIDTSELEPASVAEPQPLTFIRTLYFLIPAAGCYVLALGIYLIIGENLAVRLFWSASIALAIVPLWFQRTAEPDTNRIRLWEWGLVGVITLIGFGLRYWRLTEFPSHVDNDVARMGLYGLELIEEQNYNWLGFSNSEHLLSYDQFLAWSMRLFGSNHYGLVMSSVIAGTLTLPVVFLLGRSLFNAQTGIIATALLATSYTHIHFSRTMFGPSSTLFAALTFYLLFRGIRTQGATWFALAGITTGFAQLLYDSSRIIPVIVVAIVGWQILWQRRTAIALIKNWAVFALGALIGFGPMLGFAIIDFHSFVGRGHTVALWSPRVWNHAIATYKTDSVWTVVLEQIRRTFLTFYLFGDGSPHFSFQRPMVSALTAVLLSLGMGYALIRIRDLRYFGLVAWIMLTFILGGVITYDPPYWPHLNIVLPAVAIIAAFATDRIVVLFRAHTGVFGLWLTRAAVIIALVFTGQHNWSVYYNYADNNADPILRVARYINTLPRGYEVILVSDLVSWQEFTFQFHNHGVPGSNSNPGEIMANPPVLDRPLLFVLLNNHELGSFLQDRYPDGTLTEHFDDTGRPAAVTFRVSPQPVAKSP